MRPLTIDPSTVPQTTPKAAPPPSLLRRFVFTFAALLVFAALAHYVYRDITVGISPYKQLVMSVPCGQRDKTREIYKTPFGSFCLEKKTRDVIKRQIKRHTPWERKVTQTYSKYVKPNDTVIDVGAHIGTHTLRLAKLVGPKGRVISFEPQFKLYQELLINVELNGLENVRAEMVALGNRYDHVSMSWARDTNEGDTAIGEGGNRVELRPLDAYQLQDVAFIKIDVQGFEYHVLDGARQTLRRHHPYLILEIAGGEGGTEELKKGSAGRVMSLLRELGYTLEQIDGYDYLAVPPTPVGT